MVNVIPFNNKKHFVYAQKINCMRPTGHVSIAGKEFLFNKDNRSNGCLDWTRVDLRMKPVFLEDGGINFLVIRTKVVKVYGFFTGNVILDDGIEILVRDVDRLFGSAEAVVNHW